MPRVQGQRTPFNGERNRDSGQHRIWTTMRVMRRFTQLDLVAPSSAARRTVKDYVLRLCRAEYLTRTELPHNQPHIYRLVRDTGPYAPVLRRDGTVFDPNIERVFGAAS